MRVLDTLLVNFIPRKLIIKLYLILTIYLYKVFSFLFKKKEFHETELNEKSLFMLGTGNKVAVLLIMLLFYYVFKQNTIEALHYKNMH